MIERAGQCSHVGTQGDKKCVVTKLNRPTLLRSQPSENVFNSDRMDKLPPEVTRRVAIILLVG